MKSATVSYSEERKMPPQLFELIVNDCGGRAASLPQPQCGLGHYKNDPRLTRAATAYLESFLDEDNVLPWV
jgi:hypothetical protein